MEFLFVDMLENDDSYLQTKFGLQITSNIFETTEF